MNDKNDYSFLNEVLKNKRIVLLGEQTHGDGATFDEKVKIVKHLNYKLGLNTIVFQSGFYENYKAWKLYLLQTKQVHLFITEVFILCGLIRNRFRN